MWIIIIIIIIIIIVFFNAILIDKWRVPLHGKRELNIFQIFNLISKHLNSKYFSKRGRPPNITLTCNWKSSTDTVFHETVFTTSGSLLHRSWRSGFKRFSNILCALDLIFIRYENDSDKLVITYENSVCVRSNTSHIRCSFSFQLIQLVPYVRTLWKTETKWRDWP